MNALKTAIYAVYAAGGAFATNTTGLYYEEAPQGVAEPYCVYSIITGVPEYYFDSETLEDVTVQFDIISKNTSSTEAGSLYANLKTMFDDATLTVSGYDHLLLSRVRYHAFRQAEDNIWRVSVDYRVLLAKQ